MRAFRRKSPGPEEGQISHPSKLPLSSTIRRAGVLRGLGIVRDHHDRLAVLAVQHLQQQEDLVTGGAVEVARRLVADQERGSETMARAMATRCSWPPDSSFGLCPRRSASPTSVERDGGAPPPLRRGQVREQQRQLDVPLGGQHGQQVVELEHEADIGGAPGRQLAAPELVDAPPVDLDRARRGAIEPADQVQERGLPGSRRAHERHEVAVRDVEVDAMEHLDRLAASVIGLGEPADLDERAHRPSPEASARPFVIDPGRLKRPGRASRRRRRPARPAATGPLARPRTDRSGSGDRGRRSVRG